MRPIDVLFASASLERPPSPAAMVVKLKLTCKSPGAATSEMRGGVELGGRDATPMTAAFGEGEEKGDEGADKYSTTPFTAGEAEKLNERNKKPKTRMKKTAHACMRNEGACLSEE